MSRWPSFAVLVLMGALLGCGDDEPAPAVAGTTSGSGGAAGGVPAGGSGGCAAGQWLDDAGDCHEAGDGAGIPPDACAPGFVANDGGCDPVLPAAPCADGEIALPGDAECHELSPCGTGPWGDIPVDAATIFVDAAYAGGSSDGSQAAPFTTIAAALAVAPSGGLVAIAQGTYVEDLHLPADTALAGRCASLVGIVGTGAEPATLIAQAGGSAALSGVAVEGPGMGVWIQGTTATLAGVRIHDTGSFGLAVQGPAAHVTGSTVLVEDAGDLGVLVSGAELELDGAAVRETRSQADGNLGGGLFAQPEAGARGRLAIARSVVEANLFAGVFGSGSDVSVEASVIRDIEPQASDDTGGKGIEVLFDNEGGRSSLTVTTSVVERVVEQGILVFGSDGDIDATVVRDVAAQKSDTLRGWGITLHEDEAEAERTDGHVRRSLVERARDVAIMVVGSEANLEQTLVRDTQLSDDFATGRGINFESSFNGPGRAQGTVRGCAVESSRQSAVYLGGAQVTIEGTAIRGTLPGKAGEGGTGLIVQKDPETGERASATIVGSALDDNRDAGLLITGADATVERTAVRRTAPDGAGAFGVGIAAQYAPDDGAPSAVTIRSCVVEDAHVAGISVLGSHGSIEATIVRATAPDPTGGFGDGIVIASHPDRIGDGRVTGSRVEGSARAGVAAFGATVQLGTSTLECNLIALDGEVNAGIPFAFEDQGGNRCGCDGAEQACTALSSGLTPPDPIP